ncbi:Probable methyltransferase PMT4 [Linum perenne]
MRSPWLNKLSVTLGPRPPASLLLLCLVCVLVVVAVLRSTSSPTLDAVTINPVPNIYSNYRRLKEQAAVDYLELRSFSISAARQQVLDLCGKEREHFVPCYNGEEFDRHCETVRPSDRCLVRPPKDYKIPLRWPAGRDVIWSGNVRLTRDQFLSSGSMTKRLMLLEENQIAFHSEDGLIFDGVKDYSRQVAEMIGLGSDTEFPQAGIRTVLDIGCGFGSFGAHLVSRKVMPICTAAYEATGSQVQLALERGLPAMIGNFISRQFPYPSLSFDMVHCTQCSIIWDDKDGMFLIEVDRILKAGGYFVLTSPASKPSASSSRTKKTSMVAPIEEFTEKICWSLMAQQDETFIWQKTADANCYKSRKSTVPPVCNEGNDLPPYYQPLLSCISGTTSRRWIPIQNRSSEQLSSYELQVHGVNSDDFFEDSQVWRSALRNYWSLLTPLIFSDHPKRPGDEDPLPPFNMLRNVMDMNAHYGGLNAAFLEERKSVWVMNVVPVRARNTLALIMDRGFAGVLHDWCEPFPTYPRTYDMLHGYGLLSHLSSERCGMMDILLEMDRILRPEGWVVLSDSVVAIDMARALAAQMHWEARVVDPQNGSDQRILVCQKPFVKK